MVPMKAGFNMLQGQDVNNVATGSLIGGFVAGCAITLALVGLFAKFNE